MSHDQNYASLLNWPPVRITPAPATVDTSIVIKAPADKVYKFVTNASLWHSWHPATSKVSDVPARPLIMGDTVLENIHAVGINFQALWTVIACERDKLWAISTQSDMGYSRLVYHVTPVDDQHVQFRRVCEYRSSHWLLRILDYNFSHWSLTRQAKEALNNLKRIMEAPAS